MFKKFCYLQNNFILFLELMYLCYNLWNIIVENLYECKLNKNSNKLFLFSSVLQSEMFRYFFPSDKSLFHVRNPVPRHNRRLNNPTSLLLYEFDCYNINLNITPQKIKVVFVLLFLHLICFVLCGFDCYVINKLLCHKNQRLCCAFTNSLCEE